jgi:hypothetical protein
MLYVWYINILKNSWRSGNLLKEIIHLTSNNSDNDGLIRVLYDICDKSMSSGNKLTTLRKLRMLPSSGGTREVEADPLSEMLCILSLAGYTKWHSKLPLNY